MYFEDPIVAVGRVVIALTVHLSVVRVESGVLDGYILSMLND